MQTADQWRADLSAHIPIIHWCGKHLTLSMSEILFFKNYGDSKAMVKKFAPSVFKSYHRKLFTEKI